MSKHSFKLNITPSSHGSLIEMDGKPLPNVREVTVRAAVGEPATVTVTFAPSAVDIEAEAELITICRKASEPTKE